MRRVPFSRFPIPITRHTVRKTGSPASDNFASIFLIIARCARTKENHRSGCLSVMSFFSLKPVSCNCNCKGIEWLSPLLHLQLLHLQLTESLYRSAPYQVSTFGAFMNQPAVKADLDPQETAEWLEAFEGVTDIDGRERAHFCWKEWPKPISENTVISSAWSPRPT